MNPIKIENRAPQISPARSIRLISVSFAIIATGMFVLFFLRHPVDWLQPETLRVRYYGLQAGLREGSVTASLNVYDLLKPLVWEAQGGMFDGRYPIMLFDALIPKLYQPFYSWFGPFLREPINLALMLLTWFFLFLLIREWFGSWPAALVAASFWLLTSQALLDAHFPIRPNMTLLTFLLVYIFWELIRSRKLTNYRFSLVRVGIALTAAAFTHEFGLNFVPLVIILLCLERSLRRRLIPVAIVGLFSWAVYLAALFLVLPPLAARTVGYPPPMDWMTGGLAPLLAEPAIILSRVRDFVLVGIREMFHQNLGAGGNLPVLSRFIGPAAALVILIMGGRKSWRLAFPPLIPAVVNFLAIALLMFPVIPATVEMPVYYYATIIVLFILPLGGFLSGLSARPSRNWVFACLALLIIGVMNFGQSTRVLDRMPSDFGFNDQARRYTRDAINLPPVRRAAEVIPVPVYTAYPRPRVFDISRRWDTMLRVWHGEAEQVFSMLMPVLNLRLYERGYLVGDPDEFSALNPSRPGEYEARAELYWDMPARRLVDLGRLRAAAGELDPSPGEWRHLDSARSPVSAVRVGIADGLLGEQSRVALPSGRWSLEISFPAEFPDPFTTLLFFIRADTIPPGPDDVMDRVTPLPLRTCRITVKGIAGQEIFSGWQTFGWSYQFFHLILPATEERRWDLVVESEADFELIGPALVPNTALSFWEPHRDKEIEIDSAAKFLHK